MGNFTTLPQYLKENDYDTYSLGKVFHPGVSSNFTDDYPYSWTEEPFHPVTEKYINKPVCIDKKTGDLRKNLICPMDINLLPNQTLPDIESVEKAKEIIGKTNSQNNTNSFFIAVGLHKPHIPFKFPFKYLKEHPIEKFKNFTSMTYPPYALPSVAWNPYTDIRNREDVRKLNIEFPFGPVPEDFATLIRQSYYAAVTYVDDLIGQLLNHVNYENTIIVLTSDHGWSLGEHSEWSKFSNYEVSLRVPLIIYDPNRPIKKAKNIKKIVELVDIFPTIVELAHLPHIEKCKKKNLLVCTEGKSLVPLLEKSKILKTNQYIAFSQYPRPGNYPTQSPNSDKPKLHQIKIMGFTIRTNNFRYTNWINFNSTDFTKGMYFEIDF